MFFSVCLKENESVVDLKIISQYFMFYYKQLFHNEESSDRSHRCA